MNNPETVIVQRPDDVLFVESEIIFGDADEHRLVSHGEQGLRGPAGKSAFELAVAGGYQGTMEEWLVSLHAVGGISTDLGNALTKGTDEGLYVPDLVADPVAYYILAKS